MRRSSGSSCLDFADQLDTALRYYGFASTLDRHGISGGEVRLNNLIRDADTVAFVLSPASAKSEICAWEVDEAVRLGKRIIPVLCRQLDVPAHRRSSGISITSSSTPNLSHQAPASAQGSSGSALHSIPISSGCANTLAICSGRRSGTEAADPPIGCCRVLT
jgi:hypothetical protein